MTFGSLFSGIGGIDLGLQRAGFEIRFQVEIDPWCRRVLAKHWPDVKRYEDVRDVGADNLEAVDLIAGGFPCQPFSLAGQRRGESDDRNLWPEMRRIVDELRPRWVLAENVPGIISLYLDTVLSDLEALGYTTGAVVLPACGFDAPHIRQRLFIVANTDRPQQGRGKQPERREDSRDALASGHGAERDADSVANATSQRRGEDVAEAAGQQRAAWVTHGGAHVADAQEKPVGARLCESEPAQLWGGRPSDGGSTDGDWWATEPDVGRVAYGIPGRVDRLRGLGNAVVPQVIECIGRQIREVDSDR